ncbi:hypothetical protein GGE60_005002 [Rhizobium leucaenae]|uniref:Uncharacterized protein n=1 Tax=Rhizobium leucaenae TaxID=29450 RepID=A0A7W6ZYF9_9HYPH|nr:hypothetical protein [Rhizobium leucaenae]
MADDINGIRFRLYMGLVNDNCDINVIVVINQLIFPN